ncbi:hypothetical protein [uncultured Alistipes sp.]|uniref:hypothetical protein n=1 Tax=uncultured Alistipes sp. TaxID=538949 RepID=UPI0025E4A8AB|nr:hypothetical protein [uncultured Alistipes sp.]
MEKMKKDFRGAGLRGRFMHWAKEKMTGEDAFGILFGEKAKELPEEMKKEFVELFDECMQVHRKLHDDRKAFMGKWKEYMPEMGGCPDGARFGGGHSPEHGSMDHAGWGGGFAEYCGEMPGCGDGFAGGPGGHGGHGGHFGPGRGFFGR